MISLDSSGQKTVASSLPTKTLLNRAPDYLCIQSEETRMDQKVLLVAIVAVVAAVIVIGVWVTGAGQSGPLSGAISGCSVQPQLDAGAYNGMVYTVI